MTALLLALGGLVALVGFVIVLLDMANRRGASDANMATRAQTAEANVAALKKREEIDNAVAATDDTRLADLARRVLHNKP